MAVPTATAAERLYDNWRLDMQPPKILPPHYFVLSLVAMTAVTVLFGRGLLNHAIVYAGVVPMLIGLIMAVRASRQFSDAGTNIIPLTKSTALVTDGMFRWTRNPMYTGMILFLGGLALVLDNLWNWLIVIVFAVVIRKLFIRREEQLMLETFGDDYAEYTRQVRRWL